MATVHLGRVLGAAGFTRIVAIKRLLPQFASEPDFESMFVEEAQLAARIRHPNVVPTIDVVSSDGELLLVMEYVHGEALGRLATQARTSGGVPRAIALAVVCDALHGLHAAHEAKDRQGKPLGIVHRDVSPQNVIVGVDGVARVIDFGIAKAQSSLNTTQEGFVRGKMAYMAPEQVSGEPLTRRTDVYPMGVILWELLVGDRLFPGGTRPELLQKVAGEVPRPRSRVPSIPERLDALVMHALAPKPADRFADAGEMARALEALGPVAPRSEVAAWVEATAREALDMRAQLVAAVEAEGRSVPPPAPDVSLVAPPDRSAPFAIGTPRPGDPLPPAAPVPTLPATTTHEPGANGALQTARMPPVWQLVAAGTAIAALLGLGLGFTLKKPVPPSPAAPTPVAAAPREPAPVAAAPREPAPARQNPVPAPSAAAPAAPVTAATTATAPSTAATSAREPVRTKPAPRATKPKGKDCNPPYTIDANGRRRYKAECF
jgi:eukaryotic-like serine/threonine-protein kinase